MYYMPRQGTSCRIYVVQHQDCSNVGKFVPFCGCHGVVVLSCVLTVSLCLCAPYLFVSLRKRRFCTSYTSYVPSTLKSVANYVPSKVLVGEGALNKAAEAYLTQDL